MNVTNFTISYAFDSNTSGFRKSSNFVSVTFSLPNPVDPAQFELTRLEASRKVTVWAIQDAVMRGEMSQSDAKERMEILKHNFDGMSESISKKVNANE
jgi:hypothetical protein